MYPPRKVKRNFSSGFLLTFQTSQVTELMAFLCHTCGALLHYQTIQHCGTKTAQDWRGAGGKCWWRRSEKEKSRLSSVRHAGKTASKRA